MISVMLYRAKAFGLCNDDFQFLTGPSVPPYIVVTRISWSPCIPPDIVFLSTGSNWMHIMRPPLYGVDDPDFCIWRWRSSFLQCAGMCAFIRYVGIMTYTTYYRGVDLSLHSTILKVRLHTCSLQVSTFEPTSIQPCSILRSASEVPQVILSTSRWCPFDDTPITPFHR